MEHGHVVLSGVEPARGAFSFFVSFIPVLSRLLRQHGIHTLPDKLRHGDAPLCRKLLEAARLTFRKLDLRSYHDIIMITLADPYHQVATLKGCPARFRGGNRDPENYSFSVIPACAPTNGVYW